MNQTPRNLSPGNLSPGNPSIWKPSPGSGSSRWHLLLALFASFTLVACDSGSSSSDAGLDLNLSGVEPLKGGYHYEGWLIIDSQPVSTGKFNVNDSGALVTLGGSAISGGMFVVDADVDDATAFVLTIEPAGDTDTLPATTKYMGGDIVSGQTQLSIAHGSSIGDDFSSSTGSFILATPTNGADSDELSGIWWLDPSSGTMQPGLDLPTLPAGWRYEGWSVINGTPVTTGTFTSVTSADAFDGFSGSQAGPPFPGEDFLTSAPAGLNFPTDLSGTVAVISVEPFPDDDPAPFTLKPLVGNVPASAAPFMVYTMATNQGSIPGGSVQLR